MEMFSNLTISRIRSGLSKKEFSATELATFYLNKIVSENSKYNAFLKLSNELALSQAREVDEIIVEGKKAPALGGVPSAIKDAILVESVQCTSGSKILENYKATYDAFVIQKLKEHKAVILGKTNMDEFAMGSSTEHSAFGSTKNPYDITRVPGGSSGGSAAAVAADQCAFALGSDTGGSIRQPASFCGIVGLKPTYGAVSRFGLIAFASSLDQIGPMTKTVEDAEIVFNAIKGKDKNDSTSIQSQAVPRPGLGKANRGPTSVSKTRIGVPKEYFAQGLDPQVKTIVQNTIKKLEQQGAKITEISLPHSKYTLACYYIIATSEASANLARFDGVRYGLQKKGKDLTDTYFKSRGAGFGDEVKRRIMLGTFALSSGYYDAYYSKAQKVRALIKQDFEKAFEQVDFILTPTSPFTAFKIGDKMDDPLKMYLADIYTVSVNLAGLPAMSVPVGSVKGSASNGAGLPVGLQIIGKWFDEHGIFQLGKQVEKIIESA